MITRYAVLFLLPAPACFLEAQAQVPAHVPTNGLVAWYSLNGNADDLGNQGHDGVVSGAVLTADRCGAADGAFLFDGIDDRIELSGTEDFTSTPGFSVSAWANFAEISDARAIVSKHVNFSQNGFGMGIGGNAVLFAINNGSSSQIGSPGVYNGAWHMFTAIYDGSSMFLYADTVLVGSMASVPAPNLTTMNVRIGMDSDLAPFNGSIDDVGLWERALTEEEVEQLFHSCTVAIAEITPPGIIQARPSMIQAGGTILLTASPATTQAFELVDEQGRIVRTGRLSNGCARITVEQPGMYLVRMADPSSNSTARILVH